jgi:hypothetical protein
MVDGTSVLINFARGARELSHPKSRDALSL